MVVVSKMARSNGRTVLVGAAAAAAVLLARALQRSISFGALASHRRAQPTSAAAITLTENGSLGLVYQSAWQRFEGMFALPKFSPRGAQSCALTSLEVKLPGRQLTS